MNKKISPWLIVAVLFFGFAAESLFAAQDTKARIKEAAGIFLNSPDSSITRDKILSGLVALLDITASLVHDSQYDTQIKNRIDVAKDIFQKESFFDDKARQYLSFAYRMLTDGKKYERPKELDEFVTPEEAMEKARKYAAVLLDKALASLDAGNELGTAKLLLELVLMTVTPIPG